MASTVDLTGFVDASPLLVAADALSALRGKDLTTTTAIALTKTAKIAREHLKSKAIPKFIDNPTRFTRNGTFYTPAKPYKLESYVGFKDLQTGSGTPSGRYLLPLIYGSFGREQKPAEWLLKRAGVISQNEYIIPTGATPLSFNAYGNVTGGKYVQMLSQLKSLRQIGSTQNVTNSSRARRGSNALTYFVATIGGSKGIYVRKRGVRAIRRVFHIVPKAPLYEEQLPLLDIVQTQVEDNYSEILVSMLESQLRYLSR